MQRCLRKATGAWTGWQRPQDGLDDILPPGASIELGVDSARLLYKDTCGTLISYWVAANLDNGSTLTMFLYFFMYWKGKPCGTNAEKVSVLESCWTAVAVHFMSRKIPDYSGLHAVL